MEELWHSMFWNRTCQFTDFQAKGIDSSDLSGPWPAKIELHKTLDTQTKLNVKPYQRN